MKTENYFPEDLDTINCKIKPFTFEVIQLYMNILLELAGERSNILGTELNKRGCLTIMNVITGEIIFTIPFGKIPEDRYSKYFEYSQEMTNRLSLMVNLRLCNSHTTSYQSRNEKELKYGGAIYVNYHSKKFIFSFYGMSELISEAMMIVLSKKLAIDNNLHITQKIEACERNPYWKSLYDDFVNDKRIVLLE